MMEEEGEEDCVCVDRVESGWRPGTSGLSEYPLLDMDELDRKVVLFVLWRDPDLRRRWSEHDIFSEREWLEFIRDRGECREVLELECALTGTSLDERCRVLEDGLRKIVEWHERKRVAGVAEGLSKESP